MRTVRDLSDIFERYLHGLDYSRQPMNLYAPIEYVLSLPGKRMRPVLMMLAHDVFSPDSSLDTVLPVAAGMEVFHNFTLLHDDLMDKATMRRGKPTVHCKWNDNTAILSGDEMLVLAYSQLLETCSASKPEILGLATRCFTEIMEGQQYDMDFESRDDVTQEEYIEMIRLKTSVLPATVLQMGAVIGGAGKADASLLYGFGEKIGLAFQLQDDYLDVYGDPAVFGKNIGGDILCNKKTWLYITARNMANSRQLADFDRWAAYSGPDSKAKIEAVTALYNELGVGDLSQKLIDSYFDSAMRQLDSLELPDERKTELVSYAGRLMKRKL